MNGVGVAGSLGGKGNEGSTYSSAVIIAVKLCLHSYDATLLQIECLNLSLKEDEFNCFFL